MWCGLLAWDRSFLSSVSLSEIQLQKPIMSRSHGLRRVYFLSILSPMWVQATLSQLQLWLAQHRIPTASNAHILAAARERELKSLVWARKCFYLGTTQMTSARGPAWAHWKVQSQPGKPRRCHHKHVKQASFHCWLHPWDPESPPECHWGLAIWRVAPGAGTKGKVKSCIHGRWQCMFPLEPGCTCDPSILPKSLTPHTRAPLSLSSFEWISISYDPHDVTRDYLLLFSLEFLSYS